MLVFAKLFHSSLPLFHPSSTLPPPIYKKILHFDSKIGQQHIPTLTGIVSEILQSDWSREVPPPGLGNFSPLLNGCAPWRPHSTTDLISATKLFAADQIKLSTTCLDEAKEEKDSGREAPSVTGRSCVITFKGLRSRPSEDWPDEVA